MGRRAHLAARLECGEYLDDAGERRAEHAVDVRGGAGPAGDHLEDRLDRLLFLVSRPDGGRGDDLGPGTESFEITPCSVHSLPSGRVCGSPADRSKKTAGPSIGAKGGFPIAVPK